jgi:hypothetical protein
MFPAMTLSTRALGLFCGLLSASLGLELSVQAQDVHHPLDHRVPTGVAGRWSALTRTSAFGAVQPVQFHLPGTGMVTFYLGSPQHAVPVNAPAQAGLSVGFTYRVRISNLPEFPGIEIYPTVELLDRLHAPAGLEQEFPVPIQITEADIQTVLQDQMVTKVIYVEQPDLAAPIDQNQPAGYSRVETLPPAANLLQAADLRGRPMAIVRIGGRIPDPRAPGDEFYSQSPVQLLQK